MRKTMVTVMFTAVLAAAAPQALAADGYFSYVYDVGGERQEGMVVDPPNGLCITLPEVADPGSEPAFSPSNFTDAPATVFTGTHCDGDRFTLRAEGGHASDRLKLRSVRFL